MSSWCTWSHHRPQQHPQPPPNHCRATGIEDGKPDDPKLAARHHAEDTSSGTTAPPSSMLAGAPPEHGQQQHHLHQIQPPRHSTKPRLTVPCTSPEGRRASQSSNGAQKSWPSRPRSAPDGPLTPPHRASPRPPRTSTRPVSAARARDHTAEQESGRHRHLGLSPPARPPLARPPTPPRVGPPPCGQGLPDHLQRRGAATAA
jgi:hypothetical protein